MKCKFCEDARTNIRWTSFGNTEAELKDIVQLGYQGVYLFDDLFAIGANDSFLLLHFQAGKRRSFFRFFFRTIEGETVYQGHAKSNFWRCGRR